MPRNAGSRASALTLGLFLALAPLGVPLSAPPPREVPQAAALRTAVNVFLAALLGPVPTPPLPPADATSGAPGAPPVDLGPSINPDGHH